MRTTASTWATDEARDQNLVPTIDRRGNEWEKNSRGVGGSDSALQPGRRQGWVASCSRERKQVRDPLKSGRTEGDNRSSRGGRGTTSRPKIDTADNASSSRSLKSKK